MGMHQQDVDAEYVEALRRKDMVGDGIEAAQRTANRLMETLGVDHDGSYAKANLRNARKHAERLLAVIVELGG